MIYYNTYLKDTIGNNYIGINIGNGEVEPFLNKFCQIIYAVEQSKKSKIDAV